MAEVTALRSSLSEVDKIKLMLRNAKGRLVEGGRRRDSLRRESDMLRRKITSSEKQREALYRDFETTILALQSKTDRKHLMLVKRLDGYDAEAENCEAKIEQMVAGMDLDRPTVLDVLQTTALEAKEVADEAERAHFSVARGVKVFNETLTVFRERMRRLGISESEIRGIGFDLLPDPEGGARTQPSGLISNW